MDEPRAAILRDSCQPPTRIVCDGRRRCLSLGVAAVDMGCRSVRFATGEVFVTVRVSISAGKLALLSRQHLDFRRSGRYCGPEGVWRGVVGDEYDSSRRV